MLLLYTERRKSYFVDNDFYNNIYPNFCASDYYCIKERDVTEWLNYKEFEVTKENKIINFKDSIDILKY